MKRMLVLFLFATVLATSTSAQYQLGPDLIPLKIDNIWTNAVDTTVREYTSEGAVYGYIDQVDVYIKTAICTTDFQVITVTNDWYGIEDLILIRSNVAASATYRPRFSTTDSGVIPSTNHVERYFLFGQKLKLRAYNANATNKNIAVFIKTNIY